MIGERTSKFFDSYARDFSAIYGNQQTLVNSVINEVFRKSMKLRYLRTLEGCEPIAGRSVLDIGCGPGHYSVALAQRGAASVLGIDFADKMIEIARARAQQEGVAERCHFELSDFNTFPAETRFDYCVAMGFMDYVAQPRPVVQKILSFTKQRAFFSFPVQGGVLAWQRKLRYKRRCELYLYDEKQIRNIFSGLNHNKLEIERIARDFFVTAHVNV